MGAKALYCDHLFLAVPQLEGGRAIDSWLNKIRGANMFIKRDSYNIVQ